MTAGGPGRVDPPRVRHDPHPVGFGSHLPLAGGGESPSMPYSANGGMNGRRTAG